MLRKCVMNMTAGWMKKERKAYLFLALLIVCGLVIAGMLFLKEEPESDTFLLCMSLEEMEAQRKERKLDFSRVFDAEYYLRRNPDLVAAIGKDTALRHFLEYGMDEGRIASREFNVKYYQNHNEDLAEEYGENLKMYYYHYILFGYEEGRVATEVKLVDVDLPSRQFRMSDGKLELHCRIVDDSRVLLEYVCNDEEMAGRQAKVYELPAYVYDISKGREVASLFLERIGVADIPLSDVNHKFVLVTEDGSCQSNAAYPTNPEQLCTSPPRMTIPERRSKKGLQIGGDLDGVEELAPTFVFLNIWASNIMQAEEDEYSLPYTYRGKTYFFRKDAVEVYDQCISQLAKSGFIVCASIICDYKEDLDIYYPHVDKNTNATFYAMNTTHLEGYERIAAFLDFVTSRYNGNSEEHGMVSKWMVGNEVNDSAMYNHMGNMPAMQYFAEYARTFRMVYNAVKKNNPQSMVYVPIEPWWNFPEYDMVISGKNFIDGFNEIIRQEGNIDWGLAYHAYSYPLSDPKVLNDDRSTLSDDGQHMVDEGHFAVDDLSTRTITMKNLDVLTDYFHEEALLNSAGHARSIILSEQGYTSNSVLYGPCEAEQAASLTYAYYKAEMNNDIEAFIYFLKIDDENSSMGNPYYQFGLRSLNDGKSRRKLSYGVYQVMDTKESLRELDFIKDILQIWDWEDVIPGFSEEVFASMKDSVPSSLHSGKDLSAAVISDIPPQIGNGRECLPEVVIELDGVRLENDIDYDVVYRNNIEPGTGIVIVIGLGDYCGIQTASFEIQ